MLTIAKLQDFGADVQTGLKRCVNSEDLYLRLVMQAAYDDNYAKLEEALKLNDKNAAFEVAHNLKGFLSNLELTPLAQLAASISDDLKINKDTDYAERLGSLLELQQKLQKLCEED